MGGTLDEFIKWSGWIATLGVGVLNVYQFIVWWINTKVRSTETGFLASVKQSLGSLRQEVKDAAESSDPLESQRSKRWARSIMTRIGDIEAQVNALLASHASGVWRLTKPLQPAPGQSVEHPSG